MVGVLMSWVSALHRCFEHIRLFQNLHVAFQQQFTEVGLDFSLCVVIKVTSRIVSRHL